MKDLINSVDFLPFLPPELTGSDMEKDISDDDDYSTEDQHEKDINDKSPTAENDEGHRATGNGRENQTNRKSVAQMMRDKKKQTALTLQW